MYHQKKRGKLGVKTKHRKALLRNLIRSLVIHKRIETTLAKAKEASTFADKMITIAKRGDLHARRLLISRLGCAETANALMVRIAPNFKERQGGYTRVLRLGVRPGDGAQKALLEFSTLIETPEKPKKPKKEKKVKEVKVEDKIEKTQSKEESKTPEGKKAPAKPEKEEKKESEKKGGFLSALRKFLKGDDQS